MQLNAVYIGLYTDSNIQHTNLFNYQEQCIRIDLLVQYLFADQYQAENKHTPGTRACKEIH